MEERGERGAEGKANRKGDIRDRETIVGRLEKGKGERRVRNPWNGEWSGKR